MSLAIGCHRCGKAGSILCRVIYKDGVCLSLSCSIKAVYGQSCWIERLEQPVCWLIP